MREAASRGFWMTTYAPYGYKRVHVQDEAHSAHGRMPDAGDGVG